VLRAAGASTYLPKAATKLTALEEQSTRAEAATAAPETSGHGAAVSMIVVTTAAAHIAVAGAAPTWQVTVTVHRTACEPRTVAIQTKLELLAAVGGATHMPISGADVWHFTPASHQPAPVTLTRAPIRTLPARAIAFQVEKIDTRAARKLKLRRVRFERELPIHELGTHIEILPDKEEIDDGENDGRDDWQGIVRVDKQSQDHPTHVIQRHKRHHGNHNEAQH
jgi:hypothetical protein